MELMRSPSTHPLSFRHRVRNNYRPLIDRNFLMGHDPLEEYPILVHRKPLVNIKEHKDFYQMEISLPGYDKKDITVNIEKDILTISGHKEQDVSGKFSYILREHDIDNFKRSFQLGPDADQNKVRASFKEGILTIRLYPKNNSSLKSKKRKVTVE